MGGLTSSDMFIVVTLISIILVLVIIIIVLDIINKKNKREELEIDKIFADDKEKLPELEIPASNTPSRVEEIRYVEEDEELEKTKAKLELIALREELERQKELDNLSPLAESVEEEVFNKEQPIIETEIKEEPVKYNFDKMVESVKLDSEDKKEITQVVEEDEVKAYPAEENIELPIEEINNVKLEKQEENKDNFERIIKEEPVIENVNVKPTLREFDPIKVEKLEIKPESIVETSPQVVPEVEIQEVTPMVEVEKIASNINEDLKEEEEVKQANLTRVNEIQQDLNEILNNREYEITKHENMQEEKAIISVEELTKLSEEVYDDNENYQMSYADEGNEPISIKELEKLYNTTDLREVTEIIKNEPKIVEEKVKEPTIEFKRLEDLPPISSEIKFKSSPFISPVFGIAETPASLELEQTANLDKLNDEIKKTNEFLNRLKELQKNLD